MEVGQGPNWGCSAKEKKTTSTVGLRETCTFVVQLHNSEVRITAHTAALCLFILLQLEYLHLRNCTEVHGAVDFNYTYIL
jgi:hypothetical protein